MTGLHTFAKAGMGNRTCYLFASSTSSMHIPSAASAAMETCCKMFRKQETLLRMWTIALRAHCPATINWSYLHHCLTLHGPCPKGPSDAMHRNASEYIGMHRNASTPVALKKTCQIYQILQSN